jgi:hypothetical protein
LQERARRGGTSSLLLLQQLYVLAAVELLRHVPIIKGSTRLYAAGAVRHMLRRE